jgi:hypothetical protein
MSDNQKLFYTKAPEFSGALNSMDIDTWKTKMESWKEVFGKETNEFFFTNLILTKVTGEAAKAVEDPEPNTSKELFETLTERFPVEKHHNNIRHQLLGGDFFLEMSAVDSAVEAKKNYNLFAPDNGLAMVIAESLLKAHPTIWALTATEASTVRDNTFKETISKFESYAKAIGAYTKLFSHQPPPQAPYNDSRQKTPSTPSNESRPQDIRLRHKPRRTTHKGHYQQLDTNGLAMLQKQQRQLEAQEKLITKMQTELDELKRPHSGKA